MNIVTIFDYNLDDLKNKTMLQMFIGGIIENCREIPYKICIITSQPNKVDQIFGESFIKAIKLKENNYNIPKNMPNIKNKLYNLCNLDFEFIYLDCDMYVNSDLSFLWRLRKDKPFISTVHQPNIKGQTGEKADFMNSGLQVVSDLRFLNYDELYSMGQKMNFKFPVSGTDQALLDTYCKEKGYDFTHDEIGCEWNSCAGYGSVTTDNEYNFNIRYKNNGSEYEVKINHYWDEFKPWVINCPIFSFYEELG